MGGFCLALELSRGGAFPWSPWSLRLASSWSPHHDSSPSPPGTAEVLGSPQPHDPFMYSYLSTIAGVLTQLLVIKAVVVGGALAPS